VTAGARLTGTMRSGRTSAAGRASPRRLLPLATAAVAGALLGACASTPAPLLGLYVDKPTPTHIAAVARTLRIPDQAASGYTGGISWASIASYTPFSGARNPEGYHLLLSVAMCPSPGGDLRAVPAHLDTFRTLARHLVAGGQADAVIRLGEEANGNYPGGPHSGFSWVTADSALYRSDYRRIVSVMRAVPGAHFLFDFNVNDAFTFPWPNGQRGRAGFAAYYPGDAYVDVISDDFYDNGFPTHYAGNVVGVIDEAVAHGKAWALPEWGLTGTDSPGFIATMTRLVLGSYPDPKGGTYPPALYESYFDTDDSRLGPGQARSIAALARDLGAHRS